MLNEITRQDELARRINDLRYKTRLSIKDRENLARWSRELAEIAPDVVKKAPVAEQKVKRGTTAADAKAMIHAEFGPMFPKNPRKKLSPRKYRELCRYINERDLFCVFCGRPEMSTPAHINRRSQGGHDSPQNIVRACLECHTKYDKYEIELPQHVADMLSLEPEQLS